jgi:hypothetical protein
MGQLGDLLELLHAPPSGFERVRAEYRDWTHHARSQEAFRVETADTEPEAPSAHAPMIAGGGDAAPAVDEQDEQTSRIWIDGDEKIRLETEPAAGGPVLQVKSGRHWWSYDPQNGAVSGSDPDGAVDVGGEIRALLRPGRLLAALRFEPLGPGEAAGRETARTRARPRPRDSQRDPFIDRLELHGLGLGADEYLLDVDAATGAVLRAESRRRGEPFSIREAVQIAYDERIPDERFVFEAPPGEFVRDFSDHDHPRTVGAREAAELAPFPLFVLPSIPEAWELHVTLWPGRERPASPPGVLLAYRSRDMTAGISVIQTPAGEGTDLISLDPGAADRVVRGGHEILLRRRGDGLAMSALRLERDGTGIFITSDSLDLERLIEVAISLHPLYG